MEKSKEKLILLVLMLLLGICLGYIIFDKFQDFKREMYNQGFREGYNIGFQDAVINMYQQTNNCQTTTIRVGNLTREIVDAACLVGKNVSEQK